MIIVVFDTNSFCSCGRFNAGGRLCIVENWPTLSSSHQVFCCQFEFLVFLVSESPLGRISLCSGLFSRDPYGIGGPLYFIDLQARVFGSFLFAKPTTDDRMVRDGEFRTFTDRLSTTKEKLTHRICLWNVAVRLTTIPESPCWKLLLDGFFSMAKPVAAVLIVLRLGRIINWPCRSRSGEDQSCSFNKAACAWSRLSVGYGENIIHAINASQATSTGIRRMNLVEELEQRPIARSGWPRRWSQLQSGGGGVRPDREVEPAALSIFPNLSLVLTTASTTAATEPWPCQNLIFSVWFTGLKRTCGLLVWSGIRSRDDRDGFAASSSLSGRLATCAAGCHFRRRSSANHWCPRKKWASQFFLAVFVRIWSRRRSAGVGKGRGSPRQGSGNAPVPKLRVPCRASNPERQCSSLQFSF